MSSKTYTVGKVVGDSRTETISGAMAKSLYPEHDFFNQQLDNNPYFDSSKLKPADDLLGRERKEKS